MTINKYFMPALVFVALFATIGVTRLTGDWIISGKQIPMGDMKAADLKGWMTLQQVADALAIPLDAVYQLAGVTDPANVPATTALKDLEKSVPGFSTMTLRTKAADYLAGKPAAPQPTVAPVAQPTIAPTVAPAVTAMPHTPQPGAGAGEGAGSGTGTGPTPLPAGQLLPADQIKGSMTLKDVASQTGVPLDKLLASLKLPANTNPNTQLKTLMSEGKVGDVQVVRDAVLGLLGK